MLSFIEGYISKVVEDGVVLNLSGIGVRVEMLKREFAGLEEGEQVRIFTSLHISPQDMRVTLYGFLEAEEAEIFSTLLTCPGVGPKVSLALLEMGAGRLVSAIEREEVGVLTSVSGVGGKTAQRLILELKGKFTKLLERLPERGLSESHSEVLGALKGLGFTEREILTAMNAVKAEEKAFDEMPTDELLRLVLGQLKR